MTRVLDMDSKELLPSAPDILCQQGVPRGTAGIERLLALAETAIEELAGALEPAGVLLEVTREEFAAIYPGQGSNDPESPLAVIHPRATRLALFAVTCGPAVCERIRELFLAGDFPLGAALDAGASLAADQAAQVAEDTFAAGLDSGIGALRYSPGYCGWHVTGQKALFHGLGGRPAGITLSQSCLMDPLKSVSGVIVAGPPDIHRFVNDYPFCAACTGQECRERIQSVLAPTKEGN